MKNLDMETINGYNSVAGSDSTCMKDNVRDERSMILRFLEATRIHIETDLKDMEKLKSKHDYTNERNRLLELLKVTDVLNVTVTEYSIIDTVGKGNIEALNRYNEAKNKQIKIMALASVGLTVVAVIFTILKTM